MEYEVDYEELAKEIKKAKAKNVLIQLPDGIKPDFKIIVKNLEKKCKCNIFIWGGSCFGACDLPTQAENADIDLIIHFGHNIFKKVK